MTTTKADPTTSTVAPTFPRLLGTELRRLAARRFTQVVLGLSVLGYLAAIIYLWSSHAQSTAADIAQATAQRDQQIVQIQQYTDDCLAQPGGSIDTCGQAPTAEQFPVDQFLANDPFHPRTVDNYAFAVGGAVALAGFILGASFIGAEWSTKNLIAWLFYEPRRLRLMAAKLLALCSVLLVLAALAQVVWLVSAQLLLHYRGVPVSTLGADAATFWPDIVQLQIRSALLVLPVSLLGFALASLIRNTAAALGVAFVYFAVVESLVRSFDATLQPYLFIPSIQAWVRSGGITVFGAEIYNQDAGFVQPEQIHISNLHGGVVLMVYAGVAIAAALLLFRRRDIT